MCEGEGNGYAQKVADIHIHLSWLRSWYHDRQTVWEHAAHKTVNRWAAGEQMRGWMRLVLRSWREVADGVRAGATSADCKYVNRPTQFKLARKLRFKLVLLEHGPTRQLGGWVMAVIQYVRLVCAAKIRRPISKVHINVVSTLDRTVVRSGTVVRRR